MKKIIIVIIGLLIMTKSYAQKKSNEYLQLNLGIVSEGVPGFINIEYGRVYQDKFIFKSGVWYEQSKVNTTESTSGLIMVDLLYRKSFGKFSLNGGAGIFGGMESLYSSRNETFSKKVVFGPKLLFELAYEMSKKTGVALNCGELLLFNSKYGNMYGFVGIGLKYKL